MIPFITGDAPIVPEPIQIVIEAKIEIPEEPKPKVYTIDQKIEMNYYNCDEAVEYIRADNAKCLTKPVVVPSSQSRVNTQVSHENTPQPIRNGSNSLAFGSYGSVSPYGNCVNEPGVNNPGRGNPITWAATSSTPTVGATALWTYNHTGVVTGIYEGGEYIEVRHQNYSGGRTKFHISEFRGYR